jgi:uncharacterized Rmd1/YagE family protein
MTNMTIGFANQRVVAQCLGGRFDAAALNEELLGSMRAVRHRDIISIELPHGEVVVFSFGAMVFWGVTEDDRENLVKKLAAFADGGRLNSEEENYGFELGTPQERFHADTIFLAGDSRMQRLAVSHALAQSVKLNQFERQALRTIQETASIPRQLVESGRIKLSQRDIAQMRGNLFLTKSDIILNYDLLDTPEFFWEYPELESTYEVAARYLEIKPRVDVLSKKLETIHELLEMLADEQKHKHSANLEWTIIWLIAIEILFFLVHDILRLI